jgi:hypothetical protein
MHPFIRGLGKVLRLVGISSPEDALAKQESADGPPSWRKTAVARAEVLEREKRAREKQAGE